jgi:hypothetical protein
MKEEITASRTKTALLLFVSLAFTSIGIFLPDRGDDSMTWVAIFFGLCSIVFAVMLARPRRLTLDASGFALSGGLGRSTPKMAWQDVQEFFVVSLRPGTSFIGFRFSPEFAEKHPMTKVARNLTGADGLIQGPWPGSNAKMAERLNAYRKSAVTILVN